MSIARSILFPAFLHATELHRGGAGTDQETRAAEARACGAVCGITSAPWEGLYLETDKNAGSGRTEDMPTEPDLERFLASLMYGE